MTRLKRILGVTITQETDLAVAFQRAGQVAEAVGLPYLEQARIATAVFDAAREVIDGKRRAAIEYWLDGKPPVQSLHVRLNKVVGPARVKAGKRDRRAAPIISEILPQDTPLMTRQGLQEIARDIESVPPSDALRELRRQNSALSSCLHELRREDRAKQAVWRHFYMRVANALARKPMSGVDPLVPQAKGLLVAVVDLARSDCPFLTEHLDALDPLQELLRALTCLENGVLPDMFKLHAGRGGRPEGGAAEAELRARAAAAVTVLAESKDMSLKEALRSVRDELRKAGIAQPNGKPITTTTLRNWRTRVMGGSRKDADKACYDHLLAFAQSKMRVLRPTDAQSLIDRAKAIEKAFPGRWPLKDILAQLDPAPQSATDKARDILDSLRDSATLHVLRRKKAT